MSAFPDEAALAALAGTAFPGGTVRIPAYENAILCDIVLDTPEEDVVHPLFAYLATGAEMGWSLDALFALVGASAQDGPMHGECAFDVRRPLRFDTDYRVEGEIIAITRKRGRRIGIFDTLRYRLALIDGEGEAASATSVIVLPRRAA